MKKLRTRQHIIEDLGFNFIERKILIAGHTLHRYFHDYGYDGVIHLFGKSGEYENRMIHFQLKSTDNIKYVPEKAGFAFDLSVRDLELWLFSDLEVLLILYDARKNKAYYVELQAYFREKQILLKDVNKFVRAFIPEKNVFTTAFLKKFKN